MPDYDVKMVENRVLTDFFSEDQIANFYLFQEKR